MGIDPIRFQQFNPNVNTFQGTANPAVAGGNNPSIFGSPKGEDNNLETIGLSEIISANANVVTPKDNQNNVSGVTNPFVDGNNELTNTQRVNPTSNSNPLRALGKDVFANIANINGELFANQKNPFKAQNLDYVA